MWVGNRQLIRILIPKICQKLRCGAWKAETIIPFQSSQASQEPKNKLNIIKQIIPIIIPAFSELL
jgi:hypothetical protein